MFEQLSTGRPKLKGFRNAVLLSVAAHVAVGVLVLTANTSPHERSPTDDAARSAASASRPIGTGPAAPEPVRAGGPNRSGGRAPAAGAAPIASIHVAEVNASALSPLAAGAEPGPPGRAGSTQSGAEAAGRAPGAGGADTPAGGLLNAPSGASMEAALPRLAQTAEVPARMQLGERHEFRFGLQPLTDPLLAGDSIRLLSVRQVELAGSGFRIEAQTPPLQTVDSASGAEWRWSITPTEPGAQPLDLRIDAVVLTGDQPRIVTLGTIRREVEVVLTPAQRAARFFAEYGGWFLLAGIVALIFWLRSRRRFQ